VTMTTRSVTLILFGHREARRAVAITVTSEIASALRASQ